MNRARTTKIHVVFSALLLVFAAVGWLAWRAALPYDEPADWIPPAHQALVLGAAPALVFLVSSWLLIVRDMRKSADSAHAHSRLAAIFNSSNDAIIGKTLDGTITSWNRGAEKIYGYSAAEATGRSIALLVPADQPDELAEILKKIARGAPVENYETRRIRKDGKKIHVSLSVSPVRDASGAIVGAATIARDITDRKQADHRFRSLLESAPDAMLLVNDAGKIILANAQAEAMLGYPRTELIGLTVEALLPERFRMMHQVHRAGYSVRPRVRPMTAGMEFCARRKDGSEIPVEISLSPMHSDEGVTVTASIRDVTERKKAESIQRQFEAELKLKNRELEEQSRMLEKASRLKSEFLANMSHELRTPLNAIIGFSELMHDGKLGAVSGAHKEYLGDILTSARHLQELINDILDLSKVEAGKVEFNPQPVKLSKITGEVRDILQTLSAGKRIGVSLDVAPEAEDVVLDPGKLKQVLYNYLSNALKFTPEEGRVIVRARAEGPDMLRIEVEDNGVGIRASEIDKLFVAFQQLDSSTVKMHQGTGLGLALTKKIVEAQGGRVGVSSAAGEGSVFYAVLPKTFAASNGSEPCPPKAGAPDDFAMGRGVAADRPGDEAVNRTADV